MIEIIAWFICIAFCVLAAVSLVIYLKCFGRVKAVFDFTRREEIVRSGLGKFADMVLSAYKQASQMPYEDVYITSHDGLKLYSRLYCAPNAKGTLALFHGWRSAGMNDFSCVVMSYFEMGYNVLLTDQRAHGKSEGSYITMGAKEKYDCKCWCEYLAERFGEDSDIFLDGISMGASTVLMASGLKLPKNVRGIIADSGFTSAEEVVISVAKNAKIPPYPLIWLVEMWYWIFGGCSMGKESTLTALKRNKLPILFVHGEGDNFVPCSMTLQAYEAAGCEKYLFTAPEAGHGQSYLYMTAELTEQLMLFIDKYKTLV